MAAIRVIRQRSSDSTSLHVRRQIPTRTKSSSLRIDPGANVTIKAKHTQFRLQFALRGLLSARAKITWQNARSGESDQLLNSQFSILIRKKRIAPRPTAPSH